MYFFVLCLVIISITVQCNGSCQKAPLFAYMQDSSVLSTMSISGTYSLTLDPTNSDNVLSDSFVPMQCNNGYVLAGGQLNITCVDDTWTPFPTCVLDTSSNSVTTTTTQTPCIVDPTSIFNITNGYAANYSLLYMSDTTATGFIQFACQRGYALDPTIDAFYICNNGEWSTKPQCLITARCSFSELKSFVNSASGIQTTGDSSLMQLPTETDLILDGSYIVFSCTDGNTNIGGSLNVTCNTGGSWSPFPNCFPSAP